MLKFQRKDDWMKEYLGILRSCPLFQGIAEENLSAMLACLGAKQKHFSKRETILSEGSPAGTIGIVLSGSVQIEQVDYFGNRSIMAEVAPSQLFGESFACAGVATMPVSVNAREDSEVLLIDCLRITQSCSNACEFHRQMIFNLLQVVARKNLVFHQKISITSKRSTREKLMTYLLYQAKKQNTNRFEIPYDRQELADYLGVERSGLSAEISKLRKEGILDCHKNEFCLLQDVG